MPKSIKAISAIAFSLITHYVNAFDMRQGQFLFEVGAFTSAQGKTQDIFIQDLIGDRFYATDRKDNNALLGLGYLINGFEYEGKFRIDYGINAFYLAKTSVSGIINQEFVFSNLGYSYSLRHIPVYAQAKAQIAPWKTNLPITLDVGIGPNFIQTSRYKDLSLDGMTLPDNAFFGTSDVTFSATAGIGLKMNNAFKNLGLEIGYRFFYLGEAQLNPRTNQILNTLETGANYANAIVFTLTA